MTLIIGFVDNKDKKMYMVGDRGINDDAFSIVSASPKIFKKKFLGKDFLIGGAGDAKILQYLQYSLVLPPFEVNFRKKYDFPWYLTNVFIPHIEADCLCDDGFELLIGYDGVFYVISSNNCWFNSQHCFDAIGTAKDHALTALHSLFHKNLNITKDYKTLDLLQIVMESVSNLLPQIRPSLSGYDFLEGRIA